MQLHAAVYIYRYASIYGYMYTRYSYVSRCISRYLDIYMSKYMDAFKNLRTAIMHRARWLRIPIDDMRFCRMCCAGTMRTSSRCISASRPLRRVHGPPIPSTGCR